MKLNGAIFSSGISVLNPDLFGRRSGTREDSNLSPENMFYTGEGA